MSITYKNCEWIEAAEPQWQIGAWEPHRLVMRYQGRADKLVSEVGRYIIGKSAPSYAGMYLDSITTEDHPTLPSIVASYIGFRGRTAPSVRIYNAYNLQTVSASGETDNLGEASIEVTYLAPTSTYKWYTFSEPGDSPTYSSVDGSRTPTTVTRRVRSENQTVDGYVPVGDFTELMNLLSTDTQVTQYTSEEIVENVLWYCESTVTTIYVES